MPAWTKLEKRQITQFKDGAIYRTKIIGYEWFDVAKQPPLYVTIRENDGNQYQWCSTSDYAFGAVKPK